MKKSSEKLINNKGFFLIMGVSPYVYTWALLSKAILLEINNDKARCCRK
jgi:hypothetical protein